MDDKQTTLEILRNMRDKKVVENNPKIGLCDLFGGEANVFFRTHYGVYLLKTDRSHMLCMFEQTAQAVLGYELVHHAFWLLPLDGNGNYTLPTFDFEEDEDGEMIPTQMYDPETGQTCPEIFINEPERLTTARLKLLDDMIAYLEKELR